MDKPITFCSNALSGTENAIIEMPNSAAMASQRFFIGVIFNSKDVLIVQRFVTSMAI